ncbi:MAG: type II toxin-antitoxin system RelE/ParE family toxin [Lysobacterales bacterium]
MLSEAESHLLVSYLAEFPQAGSLIEGTGGIRKFRWAREGMGKRGGVRVIYYFHSERMPMYLLTVFGKNEKADLSMAERLALGKFVKRLVEASR